MKQADTLQPETELKIDLIKIRKSSLIVRALNHKLRVQIIKMIHDNHRIRVTEIYKKMNLEQSVASQHLSILRSAGFVSTERDGKSIFYSINYNKLKLLNGFLQNVLN
jgi:DNA-binding transcriptional ArsR family regulator